MIKINYMHKKHLEKVLKKVILFLMNLKEKKKKLNQKYLKGLNMVLF